ncbi:hypothetical protein EON77_10640 [bacterium]|nr:MAG: hypothetical protein EON77_10640 [bacterium]
MARTLSSLPPAPLLIGVALLGGLTLAGCRTGAGPTVLGSADVSTNAVGARPNGTNSNATGSSAAGGPSRENAPANATTDTPRGPAAPAELLSIDSLPVELRTDAFEYYGLGRKLPITMTLTSGGGPQVGAQDVRLIKVTPEEAQFEITSTDGLSVFGRNVVSLRRDGIRIVESEVMKSQPNDFELPTGLTPGKTWSAVQSTEDSARAMKVTLVQKVVGLKSITTKVGTYPDALYVTGEGTGTFNGKPIRMRTESWFVKGRGNVKNVIASTQSGRTDTTTIEETP